MVSKTIGYDIGQYKLALCWEGWLDLHKIMYTYVAKSFTPIRLEPDFWHYKGETVNLRLFWSLKQVSFA